MNNSIVAEQLAIEKFEISQEVIDRLKTIASYDLEGYIKKSNGSGNASEEDIDVITTVMSSRQTLKSMNITW